MRLGPRKLLAAAGVLLVALVGWLAYVVAGTSGLVGVVLAVVVAAALAQAFLLVQLGRKVSAVDRRSARSSERLGRIDDRVGDTNERLVRIDDRVVDINERLDVANERLEHSNEQLREAVASLRREQKRAGERQASLDELRGRLEALVAQQEEYHEALLRIDVSLDELAGRVERPSEQAEGLLRAMNARFRRLELEIGAGRDGQPER